MDTWDAPDLFAANFFHIALGKIGPSGSVALPPRKLLDSQLIVLFSLTKTVHDFKSVCTKQLCKYNENENVSLPEVMIAMWPMSLPVTLYSLT